MNTAEPLGLPDPAARAFAALPTRTQIARLRRLAEAALVTYDLPPTRLTLIAHSYNTTFRVDSASGERYMLRINRAHMHGVEVVGSEMAWLAALRRDTRLEVPAPMATRSGALVAVASAPGVPQVHTCVLFRWLPGRRLARGLTTRHLEQVGELTAHLHDHATHWTRPPGFTRSRVEWPIGAARWLPDPFAPEVVASIEALVAEALSAPEAAQVAAALRQVRAAEQALGPEGFGLIHADLHHRNLLFGHGVVRAIDFDDCGVGPWMWDPAVMFSEILDWPEYTALRAGWLAGYRSVRPLAAEHEAYINTFIAERRMQDALWVLEWRKHPALRTDWAGTARRSLAVLPALLGWNSRTAAGS